MRVFTNLLLFVALPLVATSAYAVPMLQLGIGGGEYDLATETIVTSDDAFTLYAYGNGVDTAESHYISIALTPQSGPDPVAFGSFEFAGTTYDIDNMSFGNPPFEDYMHKDPKDLSSHGVYETHFLEIEFLFSDLLTTGLVNTQDDPDHVPTGAGDDLFYRGFAVDVSNLLPDFGLHFDLYNTSLKDGDVDVDNFAPFSHDAGTGTSTATVPEPRSLIILALALLLLAATTPLSSIRSRS